jgi:hypothetical protein
LILILFQEVTTSLTYFALQQSFLYSVFIDVLKRLMEKSHS